MLELWLIILPLPLWFVEQVLPFPAVVEELAKAIFIRRAGSIKQAAGWGLIFGTSEALLFLLNNILLGSLAGFWWRLIFTVPMHGVTAAVMKRWGKWGLIAAVLMHAGFNLLVRR